jgi:hypothetical protein
VERFSDPRPAGQNVGVALILLLSGKCHIRIDAMTTPATGPHIEEIALTRLTLCRIRHIVEHIKTFLILKLFKEFYFET